MSIVWRENRSDLFIGLTSEEEFVSTHVIITIGIDAREDLIDVLSRIVVAFLISAEKIEHGLDNVEHFTFRDALIAVDIVHGERPFQFLIRAAIQRHVDGRHERLKVDRARLLVRMERSKNMLAEFLRLAIGISILVDFDELRLVQHARRAVGQKSIPPVDDVLSAEFRRLEQFGDDRLAQYRLKCIGVFRVRRERVTGTR